MLRKEWQYYASKARKIAKHIKTGAEENRDGTRWSKIIDVQDINATAALNKKFAKDGSRASVHTYWGGKQEIATTHTDGSKGLFQTNGECQSTNNPMDIEVAQYMNNSKNESKNMNKKLIRLTEQDLHRIVERSVNRIISELSRSKMQSAYDKMIQQGRRGQAASMNDTFNDMYNGYDSEGNFVNQTDLSGKGRHYFLNHSNNGESTISNSESTYGDETSKYNPNIAGSYLGKRNDALAQKAQQIQNWQYGKDGSTPYRTNSNMTPNYMRGANQEWRNKERAQRIGK